MFLENKIQCYNQEFKEKVESLENKISIIDEYLEKTKYETKKAFLKRIYYPIFRIIFGFPQ